MQKRGRNASMERLRVIAMLMIIGHHLVYYSGLLNGEAGINRYAAQLLNIGGKLGVNLFVLIGGWHMSVKEYRTVRTVRLWLQTALTGLVMLVVCGVIWGWNSVGSVGNSLLQILFPVSGGGWWFAGAYIVLTLFMPFLNILLRSVGRLGMDILLGVLTAVLSIIPTVFIGQAPYFAPIFWFVYLYLLAGRLRKWAFVPLAKQGRRIFVGSVALIWSSTLFFGVLKARNEAFSIPVNYYADRMETLPMLAASIGLFMCFVRKRPHSDAAAEFVGRACFGVYLIHDNPLLRGHIWGEWVRAGAWAQSPVLIPYMFFAIGMVFVLSVMVETIRRVTFGWLEDWLIDRLSHPMAKFERIIQHEILYTSIENIKQKPQNKDA